MGQMMNLLSDHQEPCLHQMETPVFHLQTPDSDLLWLQNGTLGGPSVEKGKLVLHGGKSVKGYLVAEESDTSRDAWSPLKSILPSLGGLPIPGSLRLRCGLGTHLQVLRSVTGNDVCHFQAWPIKLSIWVCPCSFSLGWLEADNYEIPGDGKVTRWKEPSV